MTRRRHLVLVITAFSLAGCHGGGGSASGAAAAQEAAPAERASAGGEQRAERPRGEPPSEGAEPAPEQAEAPSDGELVSSLAGEWQLAEPDAEERIDAAIADVTGQMSFFARDIANDRIDESVDPDERVRIEAPDAEHVVVAIGEARPTRLRLNGPAVRGTGADGRAVQSRAILRDGHLVIEERTDEGTRILTLRPRGDALVVSTRIMGEQLPDDIQFDLRYRRSGAVARR